MSVWLVSIIYYQSSEIYQCQAKEFCLNFQQIRLSGNHVS